MTNGNRSDPEGQSDAPEQTISKNTGTRLYHEGDGIIREGNCLTDLTPNIKINNRKQHGLGRDNMTNADSRFEQDQFTRWETSQEEIKSQWGIITNHEWCMKEAMRINSQQGKTKVEPRESTFGGVRKVALFKLKRETSC